MSDKLRSPSPSVKDDRLLTFKQLKELKGWPYSRMHTDRLEKAGKFPSRVRPSGAMNGVVAWWESQYDAHITSQPRGISQARARRAS
jgi:predicted DNA-binding transcriptional regulator AlpA